MELFLVRGTVIISYYNRDDEIKENVTRLVRADTIESAEDKFTSYWERKTSEYYVYYCVTNVEASYTIE